MKYFIRTKSLTPVKNLKEGIHIIKTNPSSFPQTVTVKTREVGRRHVASGRRAAGALRRRGGRLDAPI